MDVGEDWAYQAHERDSLVSVRVESMGSKKPARVKVAFLDDAFEGRVEWVPPARLKCLWVDRKAWTDRRDVEFEFARLWVDDELVLGAVEMVFHAVVPRDVASIGWKRRTRGAVEIWNESGLASLLRGSLEPYAQSMPNLRNPGALLLPWPATVSIAKELAVQHRNTVLNHAIVEDRRAGYEAAHGSIGGTSSAPDGIYETYYRPMFEILEAWCDGPIIDLDERERLRGEIEWLSATLDLALGLFRDADPLNKAPWVLFRLRHPAAMEREWNKQLYESRHARRRALDEIAAATWQRQPRTELGGKLLWRDFLSDKERRGLIGPR